MKYSKEELNEAYRKLPDELKEVFFSVDVTDSISSIGKKYNLHIDQIGELDSETGLVLLGLTHPTDFVSSMTKRLGIDRIIASQIASDINDQVFLKVREFLKEAATGEPSAHPTRDALLDALENPESLNKKNTPQVKNEIPLVEIKNPYAPAKSELGRDMPVVAPVPKTDIITQKMSGQFSMPTVTSTVEGGKKPDPYREIPS